MPIAGRRVPNRVGGGPHPAPIIRGKGIWIIEDAANAPAALHITTQSGTTASFSPQANTLLVARLAADGPATGVQAVGTVTDSLSGSWSMLKRSNVSAAGAQAIGGTVEVWCRYLVSAPGSMTVSVSWTGGNNGGDFVVTPLLHASATQNGATASAAGNGTNTIAPTVALTPTVTQSRTYGALLDYTTNASMTANTDTVFDDQFLDGTNIDTWAVWRGANENTATQAVTFGATNGNAVYQLAAVEILPDLTVPVDASIPWTPPRVLWSYDYGEAQWNQRDRRDANLVATAANPLPSPLDSAWQSGARYWHLYGDVADAAPRTWQSLQRNYVSDPSLLVPGPTDPLTLPTGPGWRAAAYVDRRQTVPQRAYVSNPSLLGTALLENELLGGADAVRHLGAAYYDRREVPQQRTYVSDPSMLATSLLEGALLGSADDIRRHYGAAYYDRREVPSQRAYISDPSFYPAGAVTDPLTLAWGAGGTYWLLYNTAALDVDRREVPQQRAYVSNPSLLGTALLENELLGGADAVRHLGAVYYDRREVPQQRQYVSDPLLLATSLLEGVLLGSADDIRRHYSAAYYDRREVPNQRAYISDPSFYPTSAPTDPLTLAWGVGGTYWLLYNTAALDVDRREVPQQRAYVSNPSLLGTALLENELLGGADDYQRRHVGFSDRRVTVPQRVYLDLGPLLSDPLASSWGAGGNLWHRYNAAATYTDRREVPNQPLRRTTYVDVLVAADPLMVAWGAGGNLWHRYNRRVPERDRWQAWLVPDIHSCTVLRPSAGTTTYVQVLTARPGTGTTTRPSTGTTTRPDTGTTEEPC